VGLWGGLGRGVGGGVSVLWAGGVVGGRVFFGEVRAAGVGGTSFFFYVVGFFL